MGAVQADEDRQTDRRPEVHKEGNRTCRDSVKKVKIHGI